MYIYIYTSKFICWPPQDLYFSIWLTFLALKWSHLLQKVSWSLRIAFWNIALPLSIELFPFNKNNTHPFLIKLFFTQNLPFLLKLLFLLSVSTPVWYDSSVFIKVFLHKIRPLSIEPLSSMQPFLCKVLSYNCSSSRVLFFFDIQQLLPKSICFNVTHLWKRMFFFRQSSSFSQTLL